MFEWLYSGVDFSLAGNGGEECANYLTVTHITVETAIVVVFTFMFEFYYTLTKSLKSYEPNLQLKERFGRKLLLAAFCLIFGIEIGYKLSTRQLIFILSPCHIVTMIQVSNKTNYLIFVGQTMISHSEYVFLIDVYFQSWSCLFHHLANGFSFSFAFKPIYSPEPRSRLFFQCWILEK